MIRRSGVIRIAAALAVVVALVIVGRQPGVREGLLAALLWVEGQGAAGAVVFVILYVTLCVLFIPESLLGLGAGAHLWHIFLARIYFLPIVAAAVWFGFGAALATALAASALLYSLHGWSNWSNAMIRMGKPESWRVS